MTQRITPKVQSLHEKEVIRVMKIIRETECLHHLDLNNIIGIWNRTPTVCLPLMT
uniref:Uncharacterized protein n=1 Tax=Arundo donax TaxID=35708 RepID=A0A0A8ZS52_ARUDO